MSPIGVFGGTFDPVHYGHLRTAFEMLQALRFDEVRFMPCGDPPHRGKTYANAALRMQMVEKAIAGQPGFVADNRELKREGPSYSVDSLSTLREDFPKQAIALMIGMDAFLGLTKWHRWHEILTLAHIVIAHRPGWRAPDMGTLGELLADRGTHRIDDLHDATAGHIYIHDVTQLEISSTDIRELIAGGRDPIFLMPDAVRKVIDESNCYANGDNEFTN
jgi:nicotinate-nucleotide adenylyltransferase